MSPTCSANERNVFQQLKKRGIGALSGDELTKVKGRIRGYDRKAKTEQISIDHMKRDRGLKII